MYFCPGYVTTGVHQQLYNYEFSDEFQLEIDQNPTLGMKDKDILYQQIPLKD